MYKLLAVFLLSFLTIYGSINFNEFFLEKTLRIDYIHSGNHETDNYFLDELIEEPYWGGSKTNLLDIFDYGEFKFEVYDLETNKAIYSRTYSTLFREWQTTSEAKEIYKAFTESVVFPFPKREIKVIFFSRDNQNKFIPKYELKINPKNYFIKKENRLKYNNFKVLNNGETDKKVDIVIIPEGYTEAEMELFKKDCSKFTQYLFNSSPYKENNEKFNVWGVLAPSPEKGTDIPAEDKWVKTNVNTSFYTFDVERYLMTSDYKSVRDLAANAPYDQIYILVNTNKYGGGAIYNFYSVAVNVNPREEYVFVHEFGHGFAFLADEYYDSETAYEEFYPLHLEPLEPNVTTRVNFESKWKHLLSKDIPIPTPNDVKYKGKVGLFEGGGYVSKGVFRPVYDCSMKSATVDNYCPVCQEAIIKMIKFYTE